MFGFLTGTLVSVGTSVGGNLVNSLSGGSNAPCPNALTVQEVNTFRSRAPRDVLQRHAEYFAYHQAKNGRDFYTVDAGWLGRWYGGQSDCRYGDSRTATYAAEARQIAGQYGAMSPTTVQPSALESTRDRALDSLRDLPGDLLTGAVGTLGRTATDISAPILREQAAQSVSSNMLWIAAGGLLAWLVLK